VAANQQPLMAGSGDRHGSHVASVSLDNSGMAA